ncbi:MAG TPA: hypothetical protein VE954_00045 [Oligoflexus sp.]|uniref:hypothetical protein n=1 Tax=Oligoflexus sp. TaxID=1971216 RepID=UPI002D4DD6A5|nr:hypothetical protein [Oligoflexus sp.]HYX31467.1 hypothetical protein [Oligoflexus sp.]
MVKNNAEIQGLKAERTKQFKEKKDLTDKNLPKFRSLFQQISAALEYPGLKALQAKAATELDIYDITFLESDRHLKDYETLLPDATRETLFPGELDQVKAYLKRLQN